jgi:hypothetical protein
VSIKANECPHGHPTIKVQTLGWVGEPNRSATREWTHELRPVDSCRLCGVAVLEGRDVCLESYVVGEDSGKARVA